MIKQLIQKIFGNKEAKNASWLIAGRILQMVFSLFVGIITARYLGPNNYGLINYAGAYVAFFSSICSLGLNSVIIKDFIDYPDTQGEAIGTSIVLRIFSSIVSTLMIVAIVTVIDGDSKITILVTGLCALALVFKAFDTINCWFQYKYKSKVTSIATLVAYVCTCVYRICLLICKADVYWFAFASSVDFIVLAVILIQTYKKENGPHFRFSLRKAKGLLSGSYHYILSGMMVAVYGQTDKIMLKQMLDTQSVGYYALASNINSMWVFVLQAIIDAMYPSILRVYKQNLEEFNKKNKQLYAIIIYLSLFVAVFLGIFGRYFIVILYGSEYIQANKVLGIIAWYTIFSYLGVARNAWIVCTNNQRYLKYMYVSASFINIVLNLLMIPKFGVQGAAIASLVTEISTSIILPCCIPDMRKNVKLILEAMIFRFKK